MPEVTLTSATQDLPDDPVAVWEYFYERGWSDGLPIIPPTRERVAAMLQGVTRAPSEVVAKLSPSHLPATVEKIAVNAVMAGCPVGVMPTLIAAVECIAEQPFMLLPMGTPPAAPFILLNGPIRHQLDINCSYAALGGVSRSNTTIGRALRLVIINVSLGGLRTIPDQCTLGMPTRISLCLGENEEGSPWKPFHTTRGFRREQSTVTVINAVSPINIVDQDAKNAAALLITIAGSMTPQGSNNLSHGAPHPLLLVGRNHAAMLAHEGLGRADLQQELWKRAWLPVEAFNRDNQLSFEKAGRKFPDGRMHITNKPEDLLVAVAGGPAGPHSQFYTTLGLPYSRVIA